MKNYGTNNNSKSLATMGDLADSKKEAFQEWGGRAITNGMSPIDSACLAEFGANRLLGFPVDRFEYQHKRDISYSTGEVDASKVASLFGDTTAPFCIGDTERPRPMMSMRLLLNFSNGSSEHSCLYCAAKKLLVCINSCGMTNLRVKVSGLTIDDVDSGRTVFTELADVPVDGWSGWNSIPLDILIGAYAGQGGDHYGRLCVEMYSTESGVTQRAGRVGICGMRLIAPTMYYSSYSLAKNNMPYQLDPNGTPVFKSIVLSNGLGNFCTLYLDESGELRANDVHGDYPLFK